jgi:ribose 5-phosphate isomerase B
MIYIGSDHGGFELKQKLIESLKKEGHDLFDEGPFAYDDSDDYPDYAEKVCRKVLETEGKGILICRSGHGMVLTANKFGGIYASLCHSKESAARAKKDENINVLCLPGDFVDFKCANEIVTAWLTTKFDSSEKRMRRLKKLLKIEENNFR